jgi:phosphoglycolate phosphatase
MIPGPDPARSPSSAHAARAIIFDLDGTLVDTLLDIATSANHALAAHGFPEHSPETYRDFIGEGTRRLIARALPADSAAMLDSVTQAFSLEYAAHLLDSSLPYPGIGELLEQLTLRSVPMCVLSNKLDALTRRMVAALFPTTPFVRVVGDTPGRPRKPDPTSALELAASMGHAAVHCALVGDSRFDMLTAQRGGLLPVGVAWGLGQGDELKRHGCQLLIERPEQVLDLLR